jgi:hypothetical protein
MEKDGLLKRVQQGRQWYVVPVDGAPPPAAGGSSKHDEGEGEEDEEEVIPDPED